MTETTLAVERSASFLVYDGHGGLSAGASSRLLYDYAPAVRDDVLDLLYLPRFGASLHVCKVEIGGDTQSTDGTEASHMHERDDLDCTRGYEWWLMKEARRRNPQAVLYGLAWGMPGWVNDQRGYYGNETSIYMLSWLTCARDVHKLGQIDYLGLWNERAWSDAAFVKALRKSLNAAGFEQTKLVLLDGSLPDASDALWNDVRQDAEFSAAFDTVGLHYPCKAEGKPVPASTIVGELGKKYWSSEDWWSEAEWPGAACWAKQLNQNFVRLNMTSTIAWSTVWSVYPVVDTFEGDGDTISGDGYWGPGLVYAWQPWSGHYVVPPTAWATAHTTQFTSPGWRMPFGQAGNLILGGSFVTYLSPDGADVSIVVETGLADCHHCDYAPSSAATQPQTLRGYVGSLTRNLTSLAMWQSTAASYFTRLADVPVDSAGRFEVTIAPDSIATITSTSGQRKGAARPPAPSAPFPAEWHDDFESRPPEGMPAFWADQCGSFQIAPASVATTADGGLAGDASRRGKQVLRQRVTRESGVNRWVSNLASPLTILGDPTDASAGRVVAADVALIAAAASQRPSSTGPRAAPTGAWAGVCGRVSSAKMGAPHVMGVCLRVNASAWALVENETAVHGAGALPARAWGVEGPWRNLQLAFSGAAVELSIDGTSLGEHAVGATAGMAGLTSGWNEAVFDNFEWRVGGRAPIRPPHSRPAGTARADTAAAAVTTRDRGG